MYHAWPQSDPAVMAPVEEREDLRAVVRKVLDRHASHEAVRAAADSTRGYSEALWRVLNDELGVSRLAVPEASGGHGFGVGDLVVVLEETGAALLPEPILASAVLGCQALIRADDPAAHSDLIEAALSGDVVVAFSDTPHAVAAEASADGSAWTLRGTVSRVLQGEAADHLVFAADSAEGLVLVVIRAADARREARTVLDLTRRQAGVDLEGVTGRLLVGPARAAEVLRRLDLLKQVALAAEHTGMVATLLDLTREYVSQRKQFGRPIGSFQAIKHRLADVLVDLERARSASRYAAAVLDESPESAELAVAVASSVCLDAAVSAAHEAVHLHGGIGFTWEHRAHYYLRRVLGNEGLGGSSRAHRARIAELVGV